MRNLHASMVGLILSLVDNFKTASFNIILVMTTTVDYLLDKRDCLWPCFSSEAPDIISSWRFNVRFSSKLVLCTRADERFLGPWFTPILRRRFSGMEASDKKQQGATINFVYIHGEWIASQFTTGWWGSGISNIIKTDAPTVLIVES